jgi:hypothetical protein
MYTDNIFDTCVTTKLESKIYLKIFKKYSIIFKKNTASTNNIGNNNNNILNSGLIYFIYILYAGMGIGASLNLRLFYPGNI